MPFRVRLILAGILYLIAAMGLGALVFHELPKGDAFATFRDRHIVDNLQFVFLFAAALLTARVALSMWREDQGRAWGDFRHHVRTALGSEPRAGQLLFGE